MKNGFLPQEYVLLLSGRAMRQCNQRESKSGISTSELDDVQNVSPTKIISGNSIYPKEAKEVAERLTPFHSLDILETMLNELLAEAYTIFAKNTCLWLQTL